MQECNILLAKGFSFLLMKYALLFMLLFIVIEKKRDMSLENLSSMNERVGVNAWEFYLLILPFFIYRPILHGNQRMYSNLNLLTIV